jgi:hypothetical protein
LIYRAVILEAAEGEFGGFRKVTAGRRVFPSDNSLLKCFYIAAMELEKR